MAACLSAASGVVLYLAITFNVRYPEVSTSWVHELFVLSQLWLFCQRSMHPGYENTQGAGHHYLAIRLTGVGYSKQLPIRAELEDRRRDGELCPEGRLYRPARRQLRRIPCPGTM